VAARQPAALRLSHGAGAWYRDARPYLVADALGRLAVDEPARRYGPSPADAAFLDKAVADLGSAAAAGSDASAAARKLLGRYVPDGPGRDAPAERWSAWLKENRPYLFFSDAGGYRWYLDPLAKKRGLPSADVRGPARATGR
jgi:hypothetical protein